MSADIFISFASQDSKIASTICAAIESRGFKCWISSRDILPGENFQSAIVRAIRSSKILLLVFTANSNRSDEMTKELALASQQKLMVVPLRVEDVTPSDAFAYEFATRQWIDLFSDWEQAMNQLCTRLGAALANEPTPNDTIVLGKPAAETPRRAGSGASRQVASAPLPWPRRRPRRRQGSQGRVSAARQGGLTAAQESGHCRRVVALIAGGRRCDSGPDEAAGDDGAPATAAAPAAARKRLPNPRSK